MAHMSTPNMASVGCVVAIPLERAVGMKIVALTTRVLCQVQKGNMAPIDRYLGYMERRWRV